MSIMELSNFGTGRFSGHKNITNTSVRIKPPSRLNNMLKTLKTPKLKIKKPTQSSIA